MLREAARRAADRLTHGEQAAPREVERQMSALVECLASDDDERRHAMPAVHVQRRCVDAFRRELLALATGLDDALPPRELLALLTALEDIGSQSSRPGRDEFMERLADPAARTAVIEIAHDMRSPLSSILFLVDTIQRGRSGPINTVQERQLGLIYGAALGLSTLASDVIDAIRGDRLVDGRPVPFSVTETITTVCAIVRPIAEEEELPIITTFPRVDGRVGYPMAINRVLLNLMTNALRYTHAGSVSVGCAELTESRVEFWVKDTGAGIPDRVRKVLFDGFRPAESGVKFSSSGLGLAICRNLVEAMGGTLCVESSPDAGTRFSFAIELPHA